MAIYRPDYKMREASKIVSELGDSEKDEHIKYYIQKKQEQINKQDDELAEYRKFFKQMDRFLPNKNMVMG